VARRRDSDGTPRTPGTSDADAEEFARAMVDVLRLAPDPRGRVRAMPSLGPPRTAIPSGDPPTETDAGGSAAAGFVAPGVDRRELRKLKRGDHVATDWLDLHGLTAENAVASVTRFIDQRRHRHRCVCVVHGRGLHSEGNVSILKARVRLCLRRHRGVLAYADAPRGEGGPGAVFVLLRK
jgi:DNA-nicking Smr family endonuclease